MTRRTIFLLAGEPSGDRLGAALMRALKTESSDELHFIGAGGEGMIAQGLQPVFDMREISVMGFVEVLPHIPRILKRLREAADAVEATQPDALITIDAQVFAAMLAKRAAKSSPQTKRIQYVAPSVWAWKPWRARAAAGIYDLMLTLFPFEPGYFTKHGLETECVGHPLIERLAALTKDAGAKLRADEGIAPDAPLLLIAPGSRRSEISRLARPFGDAFATLKAQIPELEAILPVAPQVAAEVEAAIESWSVKPRLIRFTGEFEADEARKFAAFQAATAALAASGTVTLELAGTRTPTVIGYKMPRLSEWILRAMIKIRTGSLVNIILGRNAIPEYFQGHCEGQPLAAALHPLLSGGAEATAQRAALDEAFTQLAPEGQAPSLRAARAVLRTLSSS